MIAFLRVVLGRYRLAALICTLLSALTALLASQAVPDLYPVEALVLVAEPVAVHRLANPFAPVPSSKHELADLPELLRSNERLVAIVKRSGLIDQWDVGRPWPLKLKDRLMEVVRGPLEDKDRLDALVGMVDQRLFVTIEGNKVRISAQWTSRELAMTLVENTLGTLLQLRTRREGKTLQDAADALDRQYEGVRKEMYERRDRMEVALQQPSGLAAVEGDRDQLVRDQSRAAELLVAAEEKHITAEVFRQSNALRFTVVRPPVRPREPLGPGPVMKFLIGALASILAGLVCAAILGLASGRLLSVKQVSEALGLEVLTSIRLGSPRRFVMTRLGLVLAVGLAVATGAAVGLSKGQPVIALLPPLVVIGGWLLWTRPLKWPLLGLMLLAVTLDDRTDRAYAGLWQSPLWDAGKLFFTNIAFFTGFELCVIGLTGVMVLRRVVLPRSEVAKLDPLNHPAPRPLQIALIISALFIGWLVLMGLARGGVFREALWQFRELLMLPFVAMLCLYALEIPRDLPKLLGVLLVGSLTKALLGIYFMYAVAFPRGAYPPHTTGHNDTMIFVTAAVMALTLFWEKASRRHFWLLVVWVPFLAAALMLNDRRIAYVDIALALALIYLLSPMHEMKRKLTRAAVALMPVLLVYTAAGWNTRSGRLFAPVQKMRSIVAPPEDTEEESSNVERDIENFNLLKSWERNMVFGQGFGHAFTEFVPSNDFGQSNFGHIGHNSILWLLWIGGVVGFTGVFAYLAVGVFFLGRALAATRGWQERVALLVSLSIIVTYLIQCFGDMGTQSLMFDCFVGTALAVGGRLATRANVWRDTAPEPVSAPTQEPEAITV